MDDLIIKKKCSFGEDSIGTLKRSVNELVCVWYISYIQRDVWCSSKNWDLQIADVLRPKSYHQNLSGQNPLFDFFLRSMFQNSSVRQDLGSCLSQLFFLSDSNSICPLLCLFSCQDRLVLCINWRILLKENDSNSKIDNVEIIMILILTFEKCSAQQLVAWLIMWYRRFYVVMLIVYA